MPHTPASRQGRAAARLLPATRPRRVWVLAFPGVQVLDVTGPWEVFALANRIGSPRTPRYELTLVAPTAGRLATSGGLALVADRGLAEATGPVDTLVVAGGLGTRPRERDPRLVTWIRRTARRARRLASVCTGAFLLAEAGLLDGRRVATHWAMCAALQRRFPAVRVERDPIFVRDGTVVTSAGITAGMDLALELVEEDYGRELALTVARWLVMFLRRPGGQSQFSVQLAAQLAERNGLREVQGWIAEHPDAEASVAALARRAHMSPRNFARVFRREIGVTPAAYVEAQRVEAARRLLETTGRSVAEVAEACGFARVETMHRAFRRVLRVAPGQYRHHFGWRRPAAPRRREEMDMAGVDGIDPERLTDDDTASVLRAQAKAWGAPLLNHLVYARRPTIFRGARGMWTGLDGSGLLDGALKALLNRRVAALNGCEF